MNAVVRITDYRRPAPYLHFNRTELARLLGLYSSRVIRGEWRDYAICPGPGMASFCIFRHTHETPLFVISKLETRGKTKTAARQGRYVLRSSLCKLRQSDSLEDVLAVFDAAPRLLGR